MTQQPRGRDDCALPRESMSNGDRRPFASTARKYRLIPPLRAQTALASGITEREVICLSRLFVPAIDARAESIPLAR